MSYFNKLKNLYYYCKYSLLLYFKLFLSMYLSHYAIHLFNYYKLFIKDLFYKNYEQNLYFIDFIIKYLIETS